MDSTKYNEAAARPENTPRYSATVGKPGGYLPGRDYRDVTVTMTRRPDAWRVEITEAWGSNQGCKEEHGKLEIFARCVHPQDAMRQAEERARDAGMTREYLTQAASKALDECLEAGETAVIAK